jgi:hypothetical protein
MAQTGFTPIQIYFSTTATNVPLNTNLANGELAINSADGKLFYKDSGGVVQTLASQNLFASQTANYVYASPNGSAGVPTFRALVAADIPSLSATYIPYTGASSAVDLNAKTLVNVANLGVNTTGVPTIKFRAVGDNNSTSRIAMRGYSSDANSSAIRVSKFRGTSGAPQAPISGDSLGKFELAGYGTTSAEAYPQVSLEGVTTEIWGATARGAKALIKVTPNTTITQVTAVTVDQDSKVTLAGALAVTGATTLATSLSGLAKLTAGVVSTATSGTDYAPATSGSSILYGNAAGGFSNVTIGTGVAFAGGTLSATGSGGTVTSVTGTAPVVSSGGTTPAISMAAATTSVSGYLTSTDWTTFNNKSNTNGTVTSVAAITLGTTGTDLSSTVATGTTTPVITLQVPTASATNRGALSSTDWSTFNSKQAALVSGTSIKTVSGASLLGAGDVGTIGVAYGGTGITTTPSNGQIPIGNGTNYVAAAITAGSNIAVTNGAGSISIATNLTAPSITVYTTGSGTYTVPTGAKWLEVKMIGGGGGGAGGNASAVQNGGAGGNTTFGISLLAANGATGGSTSSAGGSATITSPAIGIAKTGSAGQGFSALLAQYQSGGIGGTSQFGGNGSGTANAAGSDAIANSGSGGAGGGTTNAASLNYSGAGGGAGGYIDAIIPSPSATYSYAVGAGGTAGAAGGVIGYAGGVGGSGSIYITAYFG